MALMKNSSSTIPSSEVAYNDFIDTPSLVEALKMADPDGSNDRLVALMHSFICAASDWSSPEAQLSDEDLIMALDDSLSWLDSLVGDTAQINHMVVDRDRKAYIEVEVVTGSTTVFKGIYDMPTARLMWKKRLLQRKASK